MVLRSTEGIRAFCRELSSDSPSPGGGSAAAAAGAIAASLLSMVCGISLKSQKCSEDWPRLSELKAAMDGSAEAMLELVDEDADAYDSLVKAARQMKEGDGEGELADKYDAAVRHATEVPMSTAEGCLSILKAAEEVGRIGTARAWSDVYVAADLALAGLRGGLANVRINLEDMEDGDYSREKLARAESLLEEAESVRKRLGGAA